MLAGCSTPELPAAPAASHPPPSAHHIRPDNLQCVPYARAHSAVKIYGDAYLWWHRAKGRYIRRAYPTTGAVMVLDSYAGPKHAHVAVVRRIELSGHQIRVDHANWLNNGDIHLNDAVRDVSRAQNWGRVRIFNLATGRWGRHAYHVRGFIGPERVGAPPAKSPPKSINDLISQLDPKDLPRLTAPGKAP